MTRLEHIAMYVVDLKAARAFFVKYLNGRSNGGYHNPRTGLYTYFVSFDGDARLELMARSEVVDREKPLYGAGYAHIAFRVDGPEAVDALTRTLRADGYEVVSGPRTTGDGYYESCVVAIEGNLIEITA